MSKTVEELRAMDSKELVEYLDETEGWKCPVCGGKLEWKKHNDYFEFVTLPFDGEPDMDDYTPGKTNSEEEWYCEKDETHDLDYLYEALMEIIERCYVA